MMIYPEASSQPRGKKGTETVPFSKQRLSYARTVLKNSRGVAVVVLAGSEPLDALAVDVLRPQLLILLGFLRLLQETLG